MAINPLQLPAYAAPREIDFASPLAQLQQNYKQAQVRQTLANLPRSPDGQIDTAPLFASGDLTLANLGMQIDRNRAMEGRDARDFQFRQQEAQRAQQNADRSYGLQAQTAARANRSPEETASQRAAVAGQYGLERGTPEFKSYVLNGELPTTSAASPQVQTEQRRAAAAQSGLTSDHPAYQSFILTGKMPREDAQPLTATDKKAILEADEGVLSARSAIEALKKATDLSAKAFAGLAAGARGYAASFLGESSDTGKSGIATAELNNVVTSNALTQLKAIFGGAPTEGERKILLDIQGSVNQPHAVRQKIYERATQMAQNRLKFNEERAKELRGGSFYKPSGVGKPAGGSAEQPGTPSVVDWQTYFGDGK